MSDSDVIRQIENIDFSEFNLYATGLCFSSVCTSLTDQDATARMNLEHPTGIDSPWEISKETFKTGEPNGMACPDRPGTHRHLLFDC